MTKQNRPSSRTVIGPELGPISIEWLEDNAGPCVACSDEVGRGPIGFKRTEPSGPVCDLCMLELHGDLGMLLLFANAGRHLASHVPEHALEASQQRTALMTFAKIYDLGAQWPWRPVAAMDFMRNFLKRLLKQMASIPLDAVIKVVGGPPN